MGITKVSNSVLNLSGNTDALGLPKGTDAQRPTPVAGMLRFNTTTGEFEGYNGTEWGKINEVSNSYDVDYLVIAGAGSGGNNYELSPYEGYGNPGGGGGTGGYLTSSYDLTLSTVYNVVVGAGGTGTAGSGLGGNGNNSSLDTITSLGGGAGGSEKSNNGQDGGSGGGASLNGSVGVGTVGQGFDGGIGGQPNSTGGGGGGGASENGFVGGGGAGGAGGAGLASSITGSSVYRAGGGNGFRSRIRL